jgi:hypothetical protein
MNVPPQRISNDKRPFSMSKSDHFNDGVLKEKFFRKVTKGKVLKINNLKIR